MRKEMFLEIVDSTETSFEVLFANAKYCLFSCIDMYLFLPFWVSLLTSRGENASATTTLGA